MSSTNFFARQYIEYLLSSGVSISQISRAARTEEALIRQGLNYQEGILLSIDQYLHLLNWSARYFNDEDAYGIHLLGAGLFEDLGIIGSLLRYAPTVREGIKLFLEYGRILSPGYKLELQEAEGASRIVYHLLGNSREDLRHEVEYSFATLVQFLERFPDDTWKPLRVSLACNPPRKTSVQRKTFGDYLYYNQSEYCIEFGCAVLDQRLGQRNLELAAVLSVQARSILRDISESCDLQNQVRMVILNDIALGGLTSDSVAKTLHISRATLHRKLSSEGVSFKQLRDDVVQTLAKQSLKTNIKISELALELGYSEHSAFVRAFQRLNGITPKQYRHHNSK